MATIKNGRFFAALELVTLGTTPVMIFFEPAKVDVCQQFLDPSAELKKAHLCLQIYFIRVFLDKSQTRLGIIQECSKFETGSGRPFRIRYFHRCLSSFPWQKSIPSDNNKFVFLSLDVS